VCVIVVQVDEDGIQIAKKRRVGPSSRRSYVVRPVDDITEEELDNIADRAKDKIWDKDHVSRYCRHNNGWGGVRVVGVADRRSAWCLPGQLMSPVPAEDPGHQDGVSQRVLRGGQGSVLRAVLEEPLRRGSPRGAAGPGQ